MSECTHRVLVLCSPAEKKLRCRHCQLTISRQELGEGYCPECFAERGVRHEDFDEVEPDGAEVVRYRCESCQLVIELEG